MSTININDLGAATELSASDVFLIDTGTTTKKAPYSLIQTAMVAAAEEAAAVEHVQHIHIKVGDDSTELTTGVGKAYYRMPYAFTLSAVRAWVIGASSENNITVDVNLGGTSVLGTKITIEETEDSSVTATAAPTITTANLTDDGLITVDIDAAGTEAYGLNVLLIGKRKLA